VLYNWRMINVNDLWFSYTGAAPFVLRNVDLHISRGDYVSVVGDNGCGKSTLARLLLGLLKPVRGEITVTVAAIGYVPQRRDGEASRFPLTVGEMLSSYSRLRRNHTSRAETKLAVQSALDVTGMSAFSRSLVGELSGGQTQKVLIARALLGSPDLLVFDEPSTGIDAHSSREIYAIIRSLNRERGVTVLSVEHNIRAALDNSTHIYHLANGRGHICSPEHYAEEIFGSRASGGDKNV